MRIIGEIPHPNYKITVFKHNNRVSIKFENPNYEQVYRFQEEVVSNMADVEVLVQAGGLTQKSAEIMALMHQSALQSVQSLQKESIEEEFDKII